MKNSKTANNRTQSHKPVEKRRQSSQDPKAKPKKPAATQKQPQLGISAGLDGSQSGGSLSVEICDPKISQTQPQTTADKRASTKHPAEARFQGLDTQIRVPFDPADVKDLAQIARDFGVDRQTHHVLRYSHKRKGSQSKDYHHKIVAKDQRVVDERRNNASVSKSPVVRKSRAQRASSRQVDEPPNDMSLPVAIERLSKEAKGKKNSVIQAEEPPKQVQTQQDAVNVFKVAPASRLKPHESAEQASREIAMSKKANNHRHLSLEPSRAGQALEAITRTELIEQLKDVDMILESVRRDVRTIVHGPETRPAAAKPEGQAQPAAKTKPATNMAISTPPLRVASSSPPAQATKQEAPPNTPAQQAQPAAAPTTTGTSTITPEPSPGESDGPAVLRWLEGRLGSLCARVVADVRRADVKRRKRIRNHRLIQSRHNKAQKSTQTEAPVLVMDKKHIGVSTDRSGSKAGRGTSTRSLEDQQSEGNLELEMLSIIEIKAPVAKPTQTSSIQLSSEHVSTPTVDNRTIEALRENLRSGLTVVAESLGMDPVVVWQNLVESVDCYILSQGSGASSGTLTCKTDYVLPINQLLKSTVARMWMKKQVC